MGSRIVCQSVCAWGAAGFVCTFFNVKYENLPHVQPKFKRSIVNDFTDLNDAPENIFCPKKLTIYPNR